MEVRVLLVDDSSEVRRLLKRVVSDDDEIIVVGEAINGKEAVELVRDTSPDIVVMDVQMPVMSGIQATREIKERWPRVSVLACTSADDRTTARAMAEAGASANIDKTRAGTLLVPLVKAIGANNPIRLPEADEESEDTENSEAKPSKAKTSD